VIDREGQGWLSISVITVVQVPMILVGRSKDVRLSIKMGVEEGNLAGPVAMDFGLKGWIQKVLSRVEDLCHLEVVSFSILDDLGDALKESCGSARLNHNHVGVNEEGALG